MQVSHESFLLEFSSLSLDLLRQRMYLCCRKVESEILKLDLKELQ